MPGAIFPIIMGIKNGLTRLGPLLFNVSIVCSSIPNPPKPQPVITPGLDYDSPTFKFLKGPQSLMPDWMSPQRVQAQLQQTWFCTLKTPRIQYLSPAIQAILVSVTVPIIPSTGMRSPPGMSREITNHQISRALCSWLSIKRGGVAVTH